VINDAASYAESIAEQRGRNVDFAIDAVREGKSIPANEALEIGAIDLIALDRPELLMELDGHDVELTPDRTVTLRTAELRSSRSSSGSRGASCIGWRTRISPSCSSRSGRSRSSTSWRTQGSVPVGSRERSSSSSPSQRCRCFP
jgi:hypothetical protein